MRNSPPHQSKWEKASVTLSESNLPKLPKRTNEIIAMGVYSPSEHSLFFYHRGYKTIGETNTLKYKETKDEFVCFSCWKKN